MVKLDVGVFGIAFGCIWGLCILILGLISKVTNKGCHIINLFSKVYVGYGTTLLGSIIGAVWGFIDGAISGMLIAWVYNKLLF